jgi:hypothetical protein
MSTVTDFEALLVAPMLSDELLLASGSSSSLINIDAQTLEDLLRGEFPYDCSDVSGIYKATGQIHTFQEPDEGHCDIEFKNIKWEKIA